MTKAYVLIETAVGKSRQVTEQLSGLDGVITVDSVTGPYDIITVVQAPDLNTVGNVVSQKIHTINGIVRTVTCLVVSSLSD
jgi:DNA-binding Lrp family transcriptional regulator